jgi:hypothetical protein
MQRLFRRWDVDMQSSLTLQNVVTGIAHIKGKGDIMGSITYFFELYDDDGDGKVDREGILRISEALLFLSRRGLEGSLTPSRSMTGLSEFEAGNGGQIDSSSGTTNERFLSSVSAFIRRCFEYADPDHPQNQEPETNPPNGTSDSFGIGEDSDEEEDLLDLGAMDIGSTSPEKTKKPTGLSTVPPASTQNPANSQRKASKAQAEAANAALDPSKPLHITLPTFRMVVLADELLEQFFESSFPASFRISDKIVSTGPTSSSSSLTTFSNIGFGRSSTNVSTGTIVGASSGGVVPPSKGLRGVLDNIVTDGMRVAAEVRRRMDEAQKELEKNAVHRPEEDEDEDEGYDGPRTSGAYGGDAERRSVRSEDRDLLEGADAEAMSIRGQEGVSEVKQATLSPTTPTDARSRSASSATQKVLEFEQ